MGVTPLWLILPPPPKNSYDLIKLPPKNNLYFDLLEFYYTESDHNVNA